MLGELAITQEEGLLVGCSGAKGKCEPTAKDKGGNNELPQPQPKMRWMIKKKIKI